MPPASSPAPLTTPIIYLDLALGDETSYTNSLEKYQTVVDWYQKNKHIYGFEEGTSVDELDEVGGELLKGCFKAENPGKPCPLYPPKPLNTGPVRFRLFDTPNLQKQTLNYLHLLTSTSTLQTNKKKLGYKGCIVHRYEPGFVLQSGDVTRGDGSGGESIYGGSLPDPKPPHRPHSYGSLSYASGSAKNSSTSQFFICLANSAEVRKKKLDGKYFPFGEIVEEDVDKLKAFEGVLERDEGGWADMRKAGGRCWIFDCGVC